MEMAKAAKHIAELKDASIMSQAAAKRAQDRAAKVCKSTPHLTPFVHTMCPGGSAAEPCFLKLCVPHCVLGCFLSSSRPRRRVRS